MSEVYQLGNMSRVEGDGLSHRMVSNSTFECGPSNQSLIHLSSTQMVMSLFYFIIFLMGILGNLLVVTVIITRSTMRTSTNLYILNLAISDIIMCCFAVPITPLYTFTGRWLFGNILCKIFSASQGVAVYMSTFTLTAIALDRYLTVVGPHKNSPQALSHTIIVILALDVLAVIFTIPYSLAMSLSVSGEGVPMCEESWHHSIKTVYGTFTNITQFVLPFLTIILCYVQIGRKIKQRQTSAIHRFRSAVKQAMAADRNRKMNLMLITMVVVFGSIWFPINLINLLSDTLDMECWEFYYLVFFICHLVAMSSTCYNPAIYAWCNPDFRKEFHRIWNQSICRRSPPAPVESSLAKQRQPRLLQLVSELKDSEIVSKV